MKKPILLATSFALCVLATAKGQTQEEVAALAVKHNEALAANRAVMNNYSWNYRIEVTKAGIIQWVDLVNVKMGADGMPIFTQVNRDQIVEQQRGLFGGKKRKQEEEFEEMNKIVSLATKWIIFYNRLPADRVHTLFRKAAEAGTVNISPGNENLVGVSATNVRDSDAGDQLGLWFNKTNGHPVSFAFSTPVDESGTTISALINYRYLGNGEAFYPNHVDVSIPSDKLKIKVENVNVQKKP